MYSSKDGVNQEEELVRVKTTLKILIFFLQIDTVNGQLQATQIIIFQSLV